MKLSAKLDEHRIRSGPFASDPGDPVGMFVIPGPCGEALTLMVDDGTEPGSLGGWEHVSVSARRMPNWQEMCWIKNLCWAPDECVVQFHPAEDSYVNNHPRCLHMWRNIREPFPTPPTILIGYKHLGNLEKSGG